MAACLSCNSLVADAEAEKSSAYDAKNTCFCTMGACRKKIKQEYRKETLRRAVGNGRKARAVHLQQGDSSLHWQVAIWYLCAEQWRR
jgi:hypothetical protein